MRYSELKKSLCLQLPKHKVDWKDSHLCKSPSVDTNRNALCVYAALCRLQRQIVRGRGEAGQRGQLSEGWFNTGKLGGWGNRVSSQKEKKKSLEYGFKESWSYLATEKRNRCHSRWRESVDSASSALSSYGFKQKPHLS